jgi:hypothetical protein
VNVLSAPYFWTSVQTFVDGPERQNWYSRLPLPPVAAAVHVISVPTGGRERSVRAERR